MQTWKGWIRQPFGPFQLLSPSSHLRRLLANPWVRPSSPHTRCLSPPRSVLAEYRGSLCRPNGDHHRVPDGVSGQRRAVPYVHPVSVSGASGWLTADRAVGQPGSLRTTLEDAPQGGRVDTEMGVGHQRQSPRLMR